MYPYAWQRSDHRASTAPAGPLDFELSGEANRLANLAGQHLHLDGNATSQDRDIIGMWLREGRTPESIERVIIGLRLAIDDEAVGFIQKGTPASCAALHGTEWNGQAVWSIAEDFYYRKAA